MLSQKRQRDEVALIESERKKRKLHDTAHYQHKYQYTSAPLQDLDTNMLDIPTQAHNKSTLPSDAELMQLQQDQLCQYRDEQIKQKQRIEHQLRQYQIKISQSNKRYLAHQQGMLIITLIWTNMWPNSQVNSFVHFTNWIYKMADEYKWQYLKKKVMNKVKQQDQLKVFIRLNTKGMDADKVIANAIQFCKDYNTSNPSARLSKRQCGTKSHVILKDRFYPLLNAFAIHDVAVLYDEEDTDLGVDYLKCCLNNTSYLQRLKPDIIDSDERTMESGKPIENILKRNGIKITRVEAKGKPTNTLKIVTTSDWTLRTFKQLYPTITTPDGLTFLKVGPLAYKLSEWKSNTKQEEHTQEAKIEWLRRQYMEKLEGTRKRRNWLMSQSLRNKIVRQIWRDSIHQNPQKAQRTEEEQKQDDKIAPAPHTNHQNTHQHSTSAWKVQPTNTYQGTYNKAMHPPQVPTKQHNNAPHSQNQHSSRMHQNKNKVWKRTNSSSPNKSQPLNGNQRPQSKKSPPKINGHNQHSGDSGSDDDLRRSSPPKVKS
eukprot:661739_1